MTSQWVPHKHSAAPKYEKNIVHANKMALKARATTAKGQRMFRTTQRQNLPNLAFKFPDGRLYLPEENFIYGKPNRPSTPVGDIVSNWYGNRAEGEISQKYDILRETTKPLGLSFARGHTKASAMLHNANSSKGFGQT